MEIISQLIISIITGIIEISFEIGFFIYDLLSLRGEGESKKDVSVTKQIVLSIIGGLVTSAIVFLIIILLLKSLF